MLSVVYWRKPLSGEGSMLMVYRTGLNFTPHILYDDDISIFVKATICNIETLTSILNYYTTISRQVCSPKKSRVFYGK